MTDIRGAKVSSGHHPSHVKQQPNFLCLREVLHTTTRNCTTRNCTRIVPGSFDGLFLNNCSQFYNLDNPNDFICISRDLSLNVI